MGKSDIRTTIQVNEDLQAIAKECMKANGYRSQSELYASFLRHWALVQQPHTLTAEWAALTPEERDTIDAGLRELVEKGESVKGSWLNARIYDAIKELNGRDAKSPTILQTVKRLPEVIRKALEKRDRN